MEASKDSLVVSNNESVTNVSERDGLTRGYCSPRRYFGDVLAEIEKRGCATHINETIFFDGCRKLGFIFKAKVYGSNIKGNFLYELDNSGSYLPPENITKKMVDDDHSELSKRGFSESSIKVQPSLEISPFPSSSFSFVLRRSSPLYSSKVLTVPPRLLLFSCLGFQLFLSNSI